MTNHDKLRAAICIALHGFILWNIWNVMKMTPRIIEISACYL
jgi:hypothetical protein